MNERKLTTAMIEAYRCIVNAEHQCRHPSGFFIWNFFLHESVSLCRRHRLFWLRFS